MSDGPYHYKKAEEYLLALEDHAEDLTTNQCSELARRAQVHATLAGVAATVGGGLGIGPARSKWGEVLR